MVRAAASGIINYEDADPRNTAWNIKHKLMITELIRQSRQEVLTRYHSHVCAYLSHSNLTEDSFTKLKENASEAYRQLRENMYPWLDKEKSVKNDDSNSKIDDSTQGLINRYKEVFGK